MNNMINNFFKCYTKTILKTILFIGLLNVFGLNHLVNAQNVNTHIKADVLTDVALKNWLDKLQQQTKMRNFSGTFVVQKYLPNNIQTKTFNVTHFFDGQSEYERLIPLDGHNRSILRINQMVQAYIEDKQTIISSKREDASFPCLSHNTEQVSKIYQLHTTSLRERILGKQAHVFLLEPIALHNNHYSYKIWVDENDKSILKLQTIWQNKLLEQIFFSGIQQNIALNKIEIEQWMSYGKNWKYKLPNQQEIDIKTLEKNGWSLPKEHQGYTYIKTLEKNRKNQLIPMYQAMYSNGLATVSIFLQNKKYMHKYMQQPTTINLTDKEINNSLPIPANNFYKPMAHKNNDAYIVTAVGEAPIELLQSLINKITIPNK